MRLVLAAMLLVPLMGCRRPNADQPPLKDPVAPLAQKAVTPETPKPTKSKVDPNKRDVISTIARRSEIPGVSNALRQVGLTYIMMQGEGRPPKNLDDLKRELKVGGDFWDPFTKGWLKIIYGVKANQFPEGSSSTILAYEDEADILSRRVVLMGDGSVQTMLDEEFQKAPRALGK